MRFLRRLPVRRKLLAAVLVSSCGAALSLGLLSWRSVDSNTRFARLSERVLAAVARNGRIAQTFERQRVAIREMLLAPDNGARETAYGRMVTLDAQLDSVVANASQLNASDPVVVGLLARLAVSRVSTRRTWDDVHGAMDSLSGPQALARYDDELRLKAGGVSALIDTLQDVRLRGAAAESSALTTATWRALVATMVVAALFIAAAMALGVYVAGLIAEPVARTAEAMHRLASGDLSQEVPVTCRDELGQMADAVNRVIRSTREMTDVLSRVSRGSPGEGFTPRSSADDAGRAVEHLARTIDAVVAEVRGLCDDFAGQRVSGPRRRAFDGAFEDLVDAMHRAFAAAAPLHEATAVLRQMAGRDLTARVRGVYPGDTAGLVPALNTAIENVHAALVEVEASATHVAASSEELGQAGESLSGGSQEQAASVEQISASLHELTTMATANATSAQGAISVADTAAADARTGLAAMRELQETMRAVQASAEDSQRVTKTIDELAFQTNLLALNAAVEAARAGDAGRGFAVVAEEVRALASRSASAARETAALLEQNVTSAAAGARGAGNLDQQFTRILDGVVQLHQVLSNVEAASRSQAEGVGQIRSAVDQVNTVTQRTAANAEETASTGLTLAHHAEELQLLVQRFRLDGHAAKPLRRAS